MDNALKALILFILMISVVSFINSLLGLGFASGAVMALYVHGWLDAKGWK